MTGPDPDAWHPVPAHPRIGFLRPLAADRANVEIGRFTYYDDPDGGADLLDLKRAAAA